MLYLHAHDRNRYFQRLNAYSAIYEGKIFEVEPHVAARFHVAYVRRHAHMLAERYAHDHVERTAADLPYDVKLMDKFVITVGDPAYFTPFPQPKFKSVHGPWRWSHRVGHYTFQYSFIIKAKEPEAAALLTHEQIEDRAFLLGIRVAASRTTVTPADLPYLPLAVPLDYKHSYNITVLPQKPVAPKPPTIPLREFHQRMTAYQPMYIALIHEKEPVEAARAAPEHIRAHAAILAAFAAKQPRTFVKEELPYDIKLNEEIVFTLGI